MTEAFSSTESIDAAIDIVWTTLTDWSGAPRWMNGVDELQSEGPNAVGTQLTFTARGKERPSEIIAFNAEGAHRSITLSSAQGKVVADYTYALKPAAERCSATEITLSVYCRTEGPLMAVVGPLLRLMMKRTDGAQLSALRQVIEANAGSTGG